MFLNSFRGTARVRLGSSFHNKGGELIEVKHVIRDSRFNGSTVDYDFALFELERPIEFGAAKQPIKLQNFDEYYADDTICIVTGWGNTQNSSENRMHLRGGLYFYIRNILPSNNNNNHLILFSSSTDCSSEKMQRRLCATW